MRPSWPSRRRRMRASTSSPTERSAARAIRTALRPRSRASIWTIPARALDRSGHPNPVPRVVGNIRRRHAVGVGDLEFLRRHTHRRVKVTVPGSVHDGAAGADRLLRRQPRARRNGLRRRVERGDPRSVQCRRGRRADRRALHAGAARGGARVRPGGAQSRARGHRSAPPPCTSASATRPSSSRGRPAIPSCRSWPSAAARRCRSRPRSRAWTARCSSGCPARKSSWASSTCPTDAVETPGARGEPNSPRTAFRRSEKSF